MANSEHNKQISWGAVAWNKWREENSIVRPDLSGADLSMERFRGSAWRISLVGFPIKVKDLSGIDLSGADLAGANLREQILTGANLSGADLTGADLTHASFIDVDLSGAKLNECRVFGISAWKVNLSGAEQASLIINSENEPTITVDYLEVAQFVYLLLNNAKIRSVIDSITAKVVLILGRFTPERKAVLDGIRIALRTKGYLPILFDFEKPANRDLTETASTIAHMSRFIIVDITDPMSVPHELAEIVKNLPSVPVQPLLHASAREYGMFEHIARYGWVLGTCRYSDAGSLAVSLDEIIRLCEAKVIDMRQPEAQEPA